MVSGKDTARGLQALDVQVRYGELLAVQGVDLRVNGQIVALLGPSGSGKSTLLRAIAGLEPLAGGQLLWDGQSIAATPVHRRGFALMFQDGQLFPHRNVAGNVSYPLAGKGLSRTAKAARVAELLELVGLPGTQRRAVTTLSGGQAQRVALARALAAQPRLLLLDEPLASLDLVLRRRLAGQLRRLVHDAGIGAVYVTHDHAEAFAVADQVGVLLAGKLVRLAPPQELLQRPGSPEVAQFLAAGLPQ
ncbi:ABC transporter ATP-binding protein [Buchananella hordeovulneris]|uniref:ABC transporter ATP-binding protein n=1 Tax=Buchananella hordeovulneris TaxID=52770 RepID=UPI0026DB53BF|nr:ABC transporter ATP-binding protein [Buchananella hordeovulneris]MDO5080256.1 ABC transporter ATP-binding protein [Buchananella hordeovulneris]